MMGKSPVGSTVLYAFCSPFQNLSNPASSKVSCDRMTEEDK